MNQRHSSFFLDKLYPNKSKRNYRQGRKGWREPLPKAAQKENLPMVNT